MLDKPTVGGAKVLSYARHVVLVEPLANLRNVNGRSSGIDFRHFIDIEVPVWRFDPIFRKINLDTLSFIEAGSNLDQFPKGYACSLSPNTEYAYECMACIVAACTWSNE